MFACQVLIDSGALLTTPDVPTPATLAAMHQHSVVAAYLETVYAQEAQGTVGAFAQRMLGLVAAWGAYSLSLFHLLSARSLTGLVASLCRAAATGRVASIDHLVSLRPSAVNEPGVEGFTPVWLAVLHNHPLCFDALIRHGANASTTDEKVRAWLCLRGLSLVLTLPAE
jgi:hypothetical protein